MRRRVEEHVPAKEAERQLKLGRGGLRDVEFAVQLLQLVHGRSDVFVRSPLHPASRSSSSRPAATSVATTPPSSTAPTGSCARWSTGCSCTGCAARTCVPDDEGELRRLAPVDGLHASSRVDELTGGVAAARARGPAAAREALLPAAARRGGPARGRRGAAQPRGGARPARGARLRRPEAALRHIEALTAGRQPAGGDPADAAAGDARLVRRAPRPRRRAARLPAGQRRARARPPGTCGCCATRARSPSGWPGCSPRAATPPTCCCARPRPYGCSATTTSCGRDRSAALVTEMLAAAGRQEDPTAAIVAVRAVRRRELFRVAVGRPPGRARRRRRRGGAQRRRGRDAARRARRRPFARSSASGGARCPRGCSSSAMGRLGGHELGYGCDADVLFVHDPLDGADEREAHDAAHAVVGELRRLLALPGADPPLLVDADLRPEGRQGPLVRTLASYAAYYERWSLVVGGPGAAARRPRRRATPSSAVAFRALIDPIRWPEGGLVRRPRSGRSGGSRRASSPSGCRAAPTRRCTPSSAAAASPTSSGPSSCSSCRHAAERARAAHDAHARGARRRGRGRPASTRPTPRSSPRPGARRPGCATRSCWSVGGRPTRCRPTSASWPGSPASSGTLRAGQVTWWRTTDAPPGGRGGSWKECSTRERWRGTGPVAAASGLRPPRGPWAPPRRGLLGPRRPDRPRGARPARLRSHRLGARRRR